jgi:hypothetical protein
MVGFENSPKTSKGLDVDGGGGGGDEELPFAGSISFSNPEGMSDLLG